MRLAIILWQNHSQSQTVPKQSTNRKATVGAKPQRPDQTPACCLQQARTQPGGLEWRWLLGCTLGWGITATGLWPQLALWAGWMSHRRPTLPSALGSAFLILVAEGLLEALELICTLVGTVASMLKSSIWHMLGRSGPASCCEPLTCLNPIHLSSRYSNSLLQFVGNCLVVQLAHGLHCIYFYINFLFGCAQYNILTSNSLLRHCVSCGLDLYVTRSCRQRSLAGHHVTTSASATDHPMNLLTA